MVWLLILTAAVASGLAVYFTLSQKYAPRDEALLRSLGVSGKGRRRRSGRMASAVETFARSVELVLPMAKSDSDSLRGRLWQAGIQMPPGTFNSLSIGFSVIMTLLGVIFAFSLNEMEYAARVLLAFAIGIVSFMLPRLYLNAKIRRRKEKIEADLPMILEMLSSAMAAGLTLNLALGFVARKTEGPLSDEFALVDKEIRIAGYEMSEALRHMADRCDITAVSVFVSTIIQASAQGAGVARVLKGQAEQAREQYYQRIEEKANKTPTKMLFPLLFLIMPCVFVIILAPMLLSLMDGLSMF